MSEFSGKRYWLVGASEGLGRALAARLAREGVRLVLSARNRDRLEELASELPEGADIVPLDISDLKAVQAARAEVGEIDGLIFIAGVYWPQRTQDWNAEQVEAMCDINFTGAARVLGTVVPGFAARDRGHVVIIGSLSGFRGLPRALGYGASKAAVMHLAENLRADLHRTAVRVQLINPGFIRTRLTEKNDFAMPFIVSPEKAADLTLAGMRARRFQTNFPRVFSWVFRVSQLLPAPLYFAVFGARTR